MTIVITTVAFVTAVAAAVRSTWSPCGLSMLSTITPIGERGRGNQFRTTATWFVVGAVVGGATLGSAMGALAVGVHALHPSPAVTGAVAAVALAVAALSDLGPGGFHLPGHHRQVNERWLDQFRAWVYGAGFGWQIGTGLATYILTAAVYLLILLGALTGSPVTALALGSLFGLVRGLSVLLGRRATSPGALRELLRRFAELGPRARDALVGVELASCVAVLGALWPSAAPALGGAALAAVAAVAGLGVGRRRSHAPPGSTRRVRPDVSPGATAPR